MALASEGSDIFAFDSSGIFDKLTIPQIIQLTTIQNKCFALTTKGFFELKVSNGKIKVEDKKFESLSINNLYYCREGLIWICTNNNGVQVINNIKNLFFPLRNAFGKNNSVSSLSKSENKVLVGTRSGDVYTIDNNKDSLQYNYIYPIKNILPFNPNTYVIGHDKGILYSNAEKLKWSGTVKNIDISDNNDLYLSLIHI